MSVQLTHGAMEDFSKTLNLTSDGEIPGEVRNAIYTKLESMKEVDFKWTSLNSLSINFKSYQYSPEYILDIIKKTGFKENVKEKKSFWKRWLESMANDTDSTFGTRRLDCCSLNRQDQFQTGRRPKYRQ
ncbi:MAG: LDCC motif putative metal-binding protein [Cyclobacteriaceae bacterium]|jgi:hypothetical protein|tara:strand:- start:238 stop:624 length:387 start_codon:yes stop_codon:yes gene_type:complete